MNPDLHIPNLSAKSPANLGGSGKSATPGHFTHIPFERELVDQENRLGSSHQEKNSYPDRKEKPSALEKNSDLFPNGNRDVEDEDSNGSGSGTDTALSKEMPSISTVPIQLIPAEETLSFVAEGRVSPSSEDEPLAGYSSLETGNGKGSLGGKVGNASVSIDDAAVTPPAGEAVLPGMEGRTEEIPVGNQRSEGQILPDPTLKNNLEAGPQAPAVISEKEVAVATRGNPGPGVAGATRQPRDSDKVKERQVPATETSPAQSISKTSRALQGTESSRSVAAPPQNAGEVTLRSAPSNGASPEDAKQGKNSSDTHQEAPRARALPSPQSTRQTTPTTQASDAGRPKEVSVSTAETSPAQSISKTSRALQGTESSRSVATPPQPAEEVTSRPVSPTAQVVSVPNRKDTPGEKLASRNNRNGGAARVSPTPSAVTPSLSPAANGGSPLSTSPQSMDAQASLRAPGDLENASSDSSGKERGKGTPRDETSGNVSNSTSAQRSELIAGPRTGNLQAAFTRITQGVEQLKQDRLNSIQLRMTLDQGQSVRIHLHLRGQSLRTVIFTDSEALRTAFRDGWESFSRALSDKGVEANALQFSLSDQNGGRSTAQDQWQDKALREREFSQAAIGGTVKRTADKQAHPPQGARNPTIEPNTHFTRFA